MTSEVQSPSSDPRQRKQEAEELQSRIDELKKYAESQGYKLLITVCKIVKV